MDDDRLIRQVVIQGNVDHFRALMERLGFPRSRPSPKWKAPNGEILTIVTREREIPTRGTWLVFSPEIADILLQKYRHSGEVIYYTTEGQIS